MNGTIVILLFALALSAVHARCAPRAINISFKAAFPVPLSLHRICNGTRCGPPLAPFASSCTEVLCEAGSRCNTCTARLGALGLPAAVPSVKYGIYFSDNPSPAYSFSADWNGSASDWFKRNGWIAGCKPRVGCITRGDACGWKGIRDVTITADGCYSTLFLKLNAADLRGCVARKWRFGVSKGEVFGVDCPSRPI